MLEGYFHVYEFAFTQIPAGDIQLSTTLPFLQAIYAVVANPSAMPVIPSNYRLVSGQRASIKTVLPPRDRLSLGGQNELMSWWFVPDHIRGTSSATPRSRYNRLALAVTRLLTHFACAHIHRNFFSCSPISVVPDLNSNETKH